MKTSRFFSKVINTKEKKPVANNSTAGSQRHSSSALTTSGSSKDVQDLQEELQANREIVALLQKRLDGLVRELDSRQQAGDVDDTGRANMLVERDKQIADLSHVLKQTQQDNSIIAEKLRSTEAELKTSQEQAKMYEDMFKAKDEIIMRLTNQIFDYDQAQQESDDKDQPSTVIAPKSPDLTEFKSEKGSTQIDHKQLEKLMDMCQGYELQHKFLAKEILELNELRKFDKAREKQLIIDSAKVQAKYYQIKSKYFVLLKVQKEQDNPVRAGVEEQEVINQLLQDALEADSDDVELHLTGSTQEYDKYGFSWRHHMVEEPQDVDPLSDKAAELERQSAELSTRVKDADQDASLRVKWENYMVGRGGKIQRNQELKTLIRHGVPHEYREEVWKGCIQLYVGAIKEKKGPNYYADLLQMKKDATISNPADKQIELDLLRTLPNNKHYDTFDSDGITKLRRILLAFSEYNKVIGYCQGLNRLAAISLLFLNEEDAFWCIVAIVDHILPQHYFSTTLMAAQADQRVLKDLVQDKLPKVHQVLEANNVDLSLFTFNWFLTIFVDNIPTEMFLRIWDTLLYEGSKVLFRFAIAFLKKTEEDILEQGDGLQLNRYLRQIGEKMTNVKQISWIAFNWINPFPMRFITAKRQQHTHDIKLELLELDKLRHGMRMSREQSENTEYEIGNANKNKVANENQDKVANKNQHTVANENQNKVANEKPDKVANENEDEVANEKVANENQGEVVNENVANEKQDKVTNGKQDKMANENQDEVANEKVANEKQDKVTTEKQNEVTNEFVANEKQDKVTNEKQDKVANPTQTKVTNEKQGKMTNEKQDEVANEKMANGKQDTVTNEKQDKVANEKHDIVTNEKQDEVANERQDSVTNEKQDEVANEKQDIVTNEKQDKVANEKQDKVANEKQDIVTNEKQDEVANEKQDIVTNEKQDEVANEKQDIVANEKQDKIANEKQDEVANEKQDIVANEKQDEVANEKQDVVANEKQDEVANEKQDVVANEKQDEVANEKQDSVTNEKQDEVANEKQDVVANEKQDEVVNEKEEKLANDIQVDRECYSEDNLKS